MSLKNHANEVRYGLTDPRLLCERLGLLGDAKRQGSGVIIHCPSHGDRTPSCSVSLAKDGTIRAKCFACEFAGDALTLIATVDGLNLRSQFREVLARGAELGGNLSLRDVILNGREMPDRKPVARPEPRPEPEYPDQAEVAALWQLCVPVNRDADAWEYLRGRGIDPDAVSDGIARVVPFEAETPSWGQFRGSKGHPESWLVTGHRLLLPMWDHVGELRSVRAWRIEDGDTPKRLPPSGRRATGLVMANKGAWLMLRGRWSPMSLTIVEGEPDFLSACVLWPDAAIVGFVNGGWSDDFGKRVPLRTEVIIRTHADKAGDGYAEKIKATVPGRPIWRAS